MTGDGPFSKGLLTESWDDLLSPLTLEYPSKNLGNHSIFLRVVPSKLLGLFCLNGLRAMMHLMFLWFNEVFVSLIMNQMVG